MINPKPDDIAIEVDLPTNLNTVAHLSDLALAKAIAQAVRSIPWVAAMSPGLFAIEATYGPGERVDGVVLRRSLPASLSIEVRVVLAEAALREGSYADSRPASPSHGNQAPRLEQLADQIRGTVFQTIHDLGLIEPGVVDVALDSIQ